MDHTLDFLREQQVDKGLIQEVEAFRSRYPVAEKRKTEFPSRICPITEEKCWKWGSLRCSREKTFSLQGLRLQERIFWQENLAWIFRRPVYNVSFHVNQTVGI